MKTKNMKKTKMTTMMITTAVLVGTIGISAQSAFADTIDFETGSELDDVGTVVTPTNEVTFKVDDLSSGDLTLLPDGILIDVGAPRYGFGSFTGSDVVSGQTGDISLSNNFEKSTTVGTWKTDDYVILFDRHVANLSLDVYDFGDDVGNGILPTSTMTLEVYSDAAATVLVGSDSVMASAAGDDTISPLSVLSPSAPILSARLIDSEGDRGTAIDNIEFATALVKTSNCTDTADNSPIEVLIQKHTHPVECSFTIEFNGEADETLSIHDTVPAEWEVTNVEDLEDIDCEVETKKAGKSATHIWCPSDSSPITVEVETRESPGKGHTKNGGDPAFKPTFCGILTLNNGAVLHDDAEPPNILATSESLLYLVSEDGDATNDCDGDGLTDEQEFAIGTDPGKTDTDDDGLSDYDEVNTFLSDPLTPNTIILDTTLVGSPGINADQKADHHVSTFKAYGDGICTAYSGSVFVLDNGYVHVGATGLVRASPDCDIPALHDNVYATLHCDEGDKAHMTTAPLSMAAGASSDGTLDLTDDFNPIGTCTDATLYVESDGNGLWLARSSP